VVCYKYEELQSTSGLKDTMARFRRTKAEIAAGLSPDEAQHQRDLLKRGVEQTLEYTDPLNEVSNKLEKKNKKGDIVVRIRPAKGVDADYFEHLESDEIVIEADSDFYKWIDHYFSKISNDKQRIMVELFNRGLDELITHIHFEKDMK